MNKYYDFEELFFNADSDVDEIIKAFFIKHEKDIKSDLEYITYKIKKQINYDKLRLKNTDHLLGMRSFVKHDVIPDLNNGKEFYIYSIHTFININDKIIK